ncbi:DNA repair protein RecN [Thalassotalea mangrovi]|uniref:DNA repair protein RecN n=1 Tax=Thalassotalea mangrovi TaxID=2572245 RepID=A0A4U1B227_9GAMM|nr:DNA repair protein RecN [Thalassotalea mangrovi]TKB43096.1 DNA repair protein RecN [Thalassotalea mangrovi]
MLTNLSIRNFAIVSHVEIDWQHGMTTITGETGAGKSIAIDALGLCLGERATTSVVRPGSDKAELIACFDVCNNDKARQWLTVQDLHNDNECIIRRLITSEGRSKAYINGTPVPLAQLKVLGQLLINIHGQHDHQLLLKTTEQRLLLDDYAQHQGLLDEIKYFQKQWRATNTELQTLLESQQQRQAQQQLLQYQVKELDEFSLQEGEFSQLEADFKRHANAQQLLVLSGQCLKQLDDENEYSLTAQLQKIVDDVQQLAALDNGAEEISKMLTEASIQIQEASRDLNYYQQSIDLDPESFSIIEERYSTALNLARKHQVNPEDLFAYHQKLQGQLQHLSGDEERHQHLHDELDTIKEQYHQVAAKLSNSRSKAAKKLAKLITQSMRELSMPDAQFSVKITDSHSEQLSAYGFDDVEFLVSMNPGQPLEALHKVASGGELSRISLAIQVILAEKVITPTLIFDEVDVGISGPTAAKVGQKLQQLGGNTQVICVTHLPQVASKGRQQLFVAKLTDGKHTQTSVTPLNQDAREREIARLLAGDEITDNAIANARELLAS